MFCFCNFVFRLQMLRIYPSPHPALQILRPCFQLIIHNTNSPLVLHKSSVVTSLISENNIDLATYPSRCPLTQCVSICWVNGHSVDLSHCGLGGAWSDSGFMEPGGLGITDSYHLHMDSLTNWWRKLSAKGLSLFKLVPFQVQHITWSHEFG